MDISSRPQRVPVLRTQRRPCGTAMKMGHLGHVSRAAWQDAGLSRHQGGAAPLMAPRLLSQESRLEAPNEVGRACRSIPGGQKRRSAGLRHALPGSGIALQHGDFLRPSPLRLLVEADPSMANRGPCQSRPVLGQPTLLPGISKKSAARKHALLGKGMAILLGDFLRPSQIRHLVMCRTSLADGAIVPPSMQVA